MNTEWAELNKTMQNQIKKKESFNYGIDTLLLLRKSIMNQIFSFKSTLKREDFNAMPYANAKGNHNKTIAYSLYHIFRIEDIVANSLIKKVEQIFFSNEYCEKMNSSIITTAKELEKKEITEFSSKLNIEELYNYINAVDECTTKLLKDLSYEDLKVKMTDDDKEYLKSLKTVSEDESANWLIDYWCGKNIQGLIKMPFSRHWIMHIEASLRIKNKI